MGRNQKFDTSKILSRRFFFCIAGNHITTWHQILQAFYPIDCRRPVKILSLSWRYVGAGAHAKSFNRQRTAYDHEYFSSAEQGAEKRKFLTLRKRVATALGISEATVGRVLSDWIRRNDGEFTPHKSMVILCCIHLLIIVNSSLLKVCGQWPRMKLLNRQIFFQLETNCCTLSKKK